MHKFDISAIEEREFVNEAMKDLSYVPDYVWWTKYLPMQRAYTAAYQELQDNQETLETCLNIIEKEGAIMGDINLTATRGGGVYDLSHNQPRSKYANSGLFDEHYKDICRELDKLKENK